MSERMATASPIICVINAIRFNRFVPSRLPKYQKIIPIIPTGNERSKLMNYAQNQLVQANHTLQTMGNILKILARVCRSIKRVF